MTLQDIFNKFQNIGSIVGILITLVTFWGIISKRPKDALRRLIREETTEGVKDMKKEIGEIKEKINSKDATDLAILRNTITHIYFKYKDEKKIPHYEKENTLSLFEQYEKLGGNSYIKDIMNKISEWEEIV